LASQKEESADSLLPRRVFAVSDFEVSDGVLKFFDFKGFFKKKSVLVREIPVSEIDNIESFWNEISVTWNGVTNIFFKKNSFESFTELRDKVRGLIAENQKALQEKEASRLRSVELSKMVSSFLPVIDVVFDLLRGLNVKKVNWSYIEGHFASLGKSFSFESEDFPSFFLDFALLSDAVFLQSPQKVTKEILAIIRLIHEYFDALKERTEFAGVRPSSEDVKALIDSYLALNDVFLGKMVGDKNSPREIDFLRKLLGKLTAETNFKVNVEGIMSCIDAFNVEGEVEEVIGQARAIFKESLTQIAE